MRHFKILLILLFPLTTFGQGDIADIVLKLDELREEVKNNGYNAKEINYYDRQDNLVYTITYDRNGELEDTPMGIAIIQRKYDERGNLFEQSYYDQDRKLFRTEFIGSAIVKYKYDENDNKIETIYCDENGKPLGNGLAIIASKYDNKGNAIEERHLDNNRQLTDGICIFKYKYDAKNRKIEESKFDKKEQLIKTGDKYKNAITRHKYDKQDRVIERTYYNENNELIDGEAKIVYDYTKKHDTKDSPTNLLNDPKPKWVEQVYYDKDGDEIRRNFRYIPKKK